MNRLSSLIFFLFILTSLWVWAGEPGLLILHVWCELEPMIRMENEYPLPREEAYNRILKEAQESLSGMIYGLTFSYTPYDKTRNIPENLQLNSIAEIRWGDTNLKIVDVEERNKKLFAKVHYTLEDFQTARRQAWDSNTIPLSQGSGETNIFKGPAPKQKKHSLVEAIKNAIRNHLRPMHFNKPREVTGELLIWKEPQSIIKSGAYLTKVTVKIRIKDVRSYRIF